jgi:hypothetical protein
MNKKHLYLCKRLHRHNLMKTNFMTIYVIDYKVG